MNPLELVANDQFGKGDYVAKNLNEDPILPYADGEFDVVTCVVSIDYLINPIQVLKEVSHTTASILNRTRMDFLFVFFNK